MTIMLLRARGGESRFAEMLIKGGYYCTQYPEFVETPLPYGLHQLEQKLSEVMATRLVAADEGIPAIAVSDSLALDMLVQAIMAHSEVIPVSALPFRLVLIGEKAIRYSRQVGIAASLTINGLCTEALEQCRDRLAPLNLLLLTSNTPPKGLVAELSSICAGFDIAKVFARCKKMEPPPTSMAISATVSCTSTALREDTLVRLHRKVFGRPFFAIGPKTAAAAKAMGFKDIRMAETDTLESLYQSVAKHFGPPLLGRAL